MEYDEESISLLLKSLRFSADKHRDQRRKDEQATPYINHPIEVADTLWRIGQVRDIPTLAAAVLHDTIEDTSATPDELRSLFGNEVLGLVLEVSDDKGLPKQARKQLQIEHAPFISDAAKQIKLADKICNVYDISHSPPMGWSQQRLKEYLDWSEKVVSGLRGANLALEACYDQVLRDAKNMLAQQG
ncbi:MAG TPA: HD domain-containing protein [Anaerolineaceae bacterium]|nr:HD domain-containing protein [Anaerolineaceae bacterium]